MSESVNVPKNDSDLNITYHLLTPEDRPEFNELLLAKCYKDEPLNKSMNIWDESWANDDCNLMEGGLSFKAVCSGKIIGFILNTRRLRSSEDLYPEEFYNSLRDNTKKLLKFVYYIDEAYDVLDNNPEIDEYLEIILIFVDSEYRGHGIASKLMEKTLEYISSEKIPMMKVLCSSIYSSRIMENINCQKVFEYAYGNYELEGEKVFKNVQKPHDIVSIYLKKFNK